MKWVNHKLIAGSTALLVSHSIVFTAAAVLFATAPDSIELHNYKTNQSVLKHRGNSHNPVTWFIIFAALYAIWYFAGYTIISYFQQFTISASFATNLINNVFFGMIWGVFMHIAGDASTPGGVPIFFFKHKFTLSLFKTGEPSEYAISLLIAIASVTVIYLTGTHINI